MSPFKHAVLEIVKLIPFGKVASYGQVAAYAGSPRAARQVGWILNRNESNQDIPWWRVINNKGRITIKGARFADAELQRKLLQSERVKVSEKLELDIEKYRWSADQDQIKILAVEIV